ncbi:hypothetical protein ANANG_G00053400, partial [Anguilla anguilla]
KFLGQRVEHWALQCEIFGAEGRALGSSGRSTGGWFHSSGTLWQEEAVLQSPVLKAAGSRLPEPRVLCHPPLEILI